jgi:RNA polymerase sigma factor (sigma-70 family)
MSTETASEARMVFESRLKEIEKLTRKIAHRHRLRREEREDFCSYVAVKLLDDDCAILRKFRGMSSLRTYLTVVIHRILLDFRIEQKGKWRASTASRRLGPIGCRLDLLMNRDGHSPDQAVDIVQTTMRPFVSRDELLQLVNQVPRRSRPRLQPLIDAPPISIDGGVEAHARDADLAVAARRIRAALDRSIGELPLQDRQILRLRFADGLPICRVAAVLELPVRLLYGRLERCLKRLAVRMREEGISAADVEELIGWDGPERNQCWEESHAGPTPLRAADPILIPHIGPRRSRAPGRGSAG